MTDTRLITASLPYGKTLCVYVGREPTTAEHVRHRLRDEYAAGPLWSDAVGCVLEAFPELKIGDVEIRRAKEEASRQDAQAEDAHDARREGGK